MANASSTDNAIWLDKCPHLVRHFVRSAIPQFDGKPTADPPQHSDADPDAGKVVITAATDHNTSALITILRERGKEPQATLQPVTVATGLGNVHAMSRGGVMKAMGNSRSRSRNRGIACLVRFDMIVKSNLSVPSVPAGL